MRRASLSVAATLIVAACRSPAAEPRTMHYFEGHDADRADVIGKCTSSDRRYHPAEECANALRAERQVKIDHDAGERP